ncbi:hypothetical protein KC19_8G037100 [Ceratodon purpureus]|uniref:non-specific serine/threonine protein kinase n=1 Tax=Ceratodon purpureus TaxID=3225 RepID=A0A8T0GZ77_CERPU|nr:hypothetical protein KC19_8G037100 [Ceratodon purpureus]
MMGGTVPLFDDAFNTEAKKVTAVYKRRPKKSQEPQLPDRTSSGWGTTGGKSDGIFVFRDEGANKVVPGRKDRPGRKDSWLNRSLSFRGRRSSLVPTYRQPLASLTNTVHVSPSQGLLKKKPVNTTASVRRTWAGVPSSFVKEQRAFFADVDAFDLDAKEAFYGPSPRKQPTHLRESLDYAKSQMLNYKFVYGEALRNSTLSESELLSAALRTPHRAFGKPESKKLHAPVPPPLTTEENDDLSWLSIDPRVRIDEDIPSPEILRDKPITRRSSRLSADASSRRESSHRLSDSSWISYEQELQLAQIQASPDVYAWDQPMRRRSSRSSVDSASQGRNSRSIGSVGEETPTPVGMLTMEDNAILDFETATLLTRLESLHIREEDNHYPMLRRSVCTPVSEGVEEEVEEDGGVQINGVFRKISHCTPVPEGSEEENEEELDRLGDAASEEGVADNAGHVLEPDARLSIFDILMQECRQTEILTLSEALSDFCDLSEIKKLGEGTFGEAFKGGGNVFKIVPMDGRFQVNGETQKSSGEMLSEVVLSNALNKLRGGPMRDEPNICNTFVETKATRICQGCYDAELVQAWEDWDVHHASENDHPSIFPNQQLYVVFVLTDGGRDLESFALESFNEARSLLLQIVLALAVAEEACEFEHRDLHWGNIVLARDQHEHVAFRFLGQEKRVKTYGLSVSLIDFTLSRLNTGSQVLFCNLAADPALFEGPKNDVQANTYRRMQEVTEGQWEGRFLKTNCLWIHYVADILLTKKTFKSSPADKRSLRGFKKRVLLYESAGAAVLDEFFNGMWADL